MTALAILALASIAFVGTHFLMSHPLRAPMVARLGDKGFALAYTVVSLVTFGWMIWIYPAASAEAPQPLWDAGRFGFGFATALMWLGSVLFVGSLRRNPAFPNPGKPIKAFDAPNGVYAITRHPMMWGFTFWALVHVIVNPIPASIVLSAAIALLALVGARLQDAKKERLIGKAWHDYRAATSFVPYGKGIHSADGFALAGGTLLWLAATWAHGALGYRPAGIWVLFG